MYLALAVCLSAKPSAIWLQRAGSQRITAGSVYWTAIPSDILRMDNILMTPFSLLFFSHKQEQPVREGRLFPVAHTQRFIAIGQQLISKNPADGCALPKVEHREMKALPVELFNAFLSEAKRTGTFEMQEAPLKTKNAYRNISIGADAVSILKEM